MRTHANEAFAAARLTCHKNFLRLHVERDRLTIYAIGIAGRSSAGVAGVVAADTGDASASWIEPDEPGRAPRTSSRRW